LSNRTVRRSPSGRSLCVGSGFAHLRSGGLRSTATAATHPHATDSTVDITRHRSDEPTLTLAACLISPTWLQPSERLPSSVSSRAERGRLGDKRLAVDAHLARSDSERKGADRGSRRAARCVNIPAMELGEVGVWIFFSEIGEEGAEEAARVAEALGFGALWLGGSPRLASLRPMLAVTDRLILATGIVNVWDYEPEQLASDFAALDDEFPGRALVGIGCGHPEETSHYARPLSTVRAYLDVLDRAPRPVPPDRRCLAALGPKMLDLSAQRSLGAHPYFAPVEHTRGARKLVGPGVLVAPEVAGVLDDSDQRGLATAREYATEYLGLRNYTNNLLSLGFSEQDFEGGGSERLIEAVVPHGSAANIAAVARAHIEAGADHVCVQAVGVHGVPRDEWAAFADELIP
jgi:probable F420-dependent oxidoreductase